MAGYAVAENYRVYLKNGALKSSNKKHIEEHLLIYVDQFNIHFHVRICEIIRLSIL